MESVEKNGLKCCNVGACVDIDTELNKTKVTEYRITTLVMVDVLGRTFWEANDDVTKRSWGLVGVRAVEGVIIDLYFMLVSYEHNMLQWDECDEY